MKKLHVLLLSCLMWAMLAASEPGEIIFSGPSRPVPISVSDPDLLYQYIRAKFDVREYDACLNAALVFPLRFPADARTKRVEVVLPYLYAECGRYEEADAYLGNLEKKLSPDLVARYHLFLAFCRGDVSELTHFEKKNRDEQAAFYLLHLNVLHGEDRKARGRIRELKKKGIIDEAEADSMLRVLGHRDEISEGNKPRIFSRPLLSLGVMGGIQLFYFISQPREIPAIHYGISLLILGFEKRKNTKFRNNKMLENRYEEFRKTAPPDFEKRLQKIL